MMERTLLRWIYFSIALSSMGLSNHVFANDIFWKIKNIDASKNRVMDVSATLEQCQSGLKPYFHFQPQKLTVYLYGTRDSFVKGLEDIHHFPQNETEYFRKSSAPRPLNGSYLTPPDQILKNICHEIVHHYLESYTHRDQLLNAKWFDEGTANYLADQIFDPEETEQKKRYLLDKSGGNFIPVSSMLTESDWNILHRKMEAHSIAYLQAQFMMEYFFKQYSVDQFLNLLREMRGNPFPKAFSKVCKTSQNRFYKKWKKGVLTLSNNALF